MEAMIAGLTVEQAAAMREWYTGKLSRAQENIYWARTTGRDAKRFESEANLWTNAIAELPA